MHTKAADFTRSDNPANKVNISTYWHPDKFKAHIFQINHHKLSLNRDKPKLIWYKKIKHYAKIVNNFYH